MSTIQAMYDEVSAAKSLAATLEVELASEREAHAATKKDLRAAKAREAGLRSKLEQRGPIDSEAESWLMARRASIEFRRMLDRGEFVLLKGRGVPTTRAKTLDEAISKARERKRITSGAED